MSLSLKKQLEVKLTGCITTLCGMDYENAGRRQLVPCPEGEITFVDGTKGKIMPGGVDHQFIRNDGVCEINATYGFELEDGRTLYLKVEGIRTVPKEHVESVKQGGAVDPKLFYYVTTPKFEVYDESLKWLTEKIFVCDGTRLPDSVLLTYYSVEQVNDHPAFD